jgi:hypothetical protein
MSVGPVWLLDVDGVLNAPAARWGDRPRSASALHTGVKYRMTWAPELVAELGRLHRDGAVELRWATTWVDESAQLEELFRLPTLSTAFAGLGPSPAVKTPALKIAAALLVLEQEGRPLIWTDDDAIPARGPLRERIDAAAPPALLIAPDPRYGLQPDDLEAVAAFLADPHGATDLDRR